MTTHYLLANQVLFLHSRLVDETGGEHGLRDSGMLLSALGRPQASFDDHDLYPDVFTKAAALLDSLIRNHPFVDGNKRTAIAATAVFLELNGFRLSVDNDEMVRFTLACAQSELDLQEVRIWLTGHTESIGYN